MKASFRYHATIALVASSCALDFSWPLDLVTTCETDAHCPEGLVCRFNSCGRDAVGKDGEPCNLDGRCEAGLLCDEIVCRKSRNNEPVPEWQLAIGNGLSLRSTSIAPSASGFWWHAGGSRTLKIDGVSTQPLDTAADGLVDVVAQLTVDGLVTSARSSTPDQVLPGGSDTPTLSIVAEGPTGELLLARESNTLDADGFRYAVELLGLAPGSNVLVPFGTRTTRAGVRFKGSVSAATSTGYIAYARNGSAVSGDPYGSLLVEALDVAGATLAQWAFDPAGEEGLVAPEFASFSRPMDATPHVLLRATSLTFGVGGTVDETHALFGLVPGGGQRARLFVRGFGAVTPSVAIAPGGEAFVVFGLTSTVEILDPTGRTLGTLTPSDEADIALVRLEADGTVALTVLAQPGLQAAATCAFAGDRLVIGGLTTGAWPPAEGVTADVQDKDALLLVLDPSSGSLVYALRHGDRGGQVAMGLVPLEDGFIALGSFSSSINFGLGRLASLSGGDSWLARYRFPTP